MGAHGPDVPRCGAQKPNKPDGTLCQQAAGHGTPHPGVGRCSRHGGSTPNHVKAAEKELLQQACDRLGVQVEVDPADALLREVWETAGNVAFYRDLVQQLTAHPTPAVRTEVQGGEDDGKVEWTPGEAGVYGPTFHQSGIATGEAKPHVLVGLYNDERKHLVNVTTAALKAGIAERQVQLAEQQGALLAQVIRGILTDLGVNDRPEVPDIVRRHLTLVGSGGAA